MTSAKGSSAAPPAWLQDLPGPVAELPEQTDVLILGGGLAGLCAAALLAEGGAAVLLVEAGPRLGGAGARAVGQVAPGLLEPAHRLVAALGLREAAAITRFTEENLALIAESGALDPTGAAQASVLVGPAAREAEEQPAVLEALGALGVAARLLPGPEAELALGGVGFGPTLLLEAGGVVNTLALVRSLTARATAAGARLCCGVEARPDGTLGGRPVSAEVTVYAAGAALAELDGFFGDKLHPARATALATAAGAAPRLPGTAMYGSVDWAATPDGGGALGGARWASPHLEAGETDPDTLSPRVEAALRGLLATRFPALGPPAARWAVIQASSCDGLPLVGPIPGRARAIALTGFSGNDLRLALRAAAAVASGLLTGQAPGVPKSFQPGRFV